MSAAATPSQPATPSVRKSSLLQLQEGPLSWQQVQVAIVALGEPAGADQLELLHKLLARFVEENEDPRASPHLRATGPDRLDPLATLLSRADVAAAAPAAHLLALKAVKILARRHDVRTRCTQHVVDVLAQLLDSTTAAAGASLTTRKLPQPQHQPGLASEAANALSNLCYEPANCTCLLKTGGVPRLLSLLGATGGGIEAQVNAAGALQTLSYQPDARTAVVKAGGPAQLLRALHSVGAAAAADGAEAKLQQRLAGALHNLSSGADGITAICQQGGIPAVAGLLASVHPGVPAAAAGTLQNMSRAAQARRDIRAHTEALPGLVALLTGPDMQAAMCAAGTLANLAGETGSGATQEALVGALAGALAGGAIYHSCVGHEGS